MVLGVELLPGGEVGEGFTFGRCAGGVDFGSFAVLSVGAAPEADGVVVFQSETGWIDGLMTAGAGFVVAVLVELVADARRAADVRFDGWNAGRGRWDVITENALINKDTAHDRRGAGAIGGHFEDRSLSDEATAL